MNHLKITAVDDDSTFLSILEMMFKKFKDVKLDAQFFSDSTHALEEVCNEQPDILFLDIFMPNMNGWEFLQHLEEKKVDVGGWGDVHEALELVKTAVERYELSEHKKKRTFTI